MDWSLFWICFSSLVVGIILLPFMQQYVLQYEIKGITGSIAYSLPIVWIIASSIGLLRALFKKS